jgi:cobalt-zinc-cadmium efflux system membrane fusion protein
MRTGVMPATILVVDDDAAVRQVLGRVLAREGHFILEAADAARALQLAEEHHPQLALIDLCLAEGDATELAGRLHARQARLPLILVTGYPLRLHEDPELARPFLRVLTKPVDVNELRLAVHAALTEGAMQTSELTPHPDPAPTPPPPSPPATPAPAQPPREGRREKIKSAAVVLVALLVLVGFVAYVLGLPIPGLAASEREKTVPQQAAPKIDLVPGQKHTVSVPEDVRKALGIRTWSAEERRAIDRLATAAAPAQARPLSMSGSTGLDPTQLFRLRVRFTPAECIEIGQMDEVGAGPTKQRELRSGDVVHKGQRLALFYSVDVGNMKSNLMDALLQLRLDRKVLDASQAAYDKGALPYLDYMAAVRAVEGDYSTINRTENTLRAWYIPEEDIEAVRKEADEIYEKEKQGGKRDRSPEHLKEQLKRWARVELRVPDEFDGGVIVERNLSVKDVVVDNTLNLFQIAKVDRLLVVANAPEDELPTLHGLSTGQRRWTIYTVGASPKGIPGPIDDISYIIDVNQHSAVVKGHIPNDGTLRSGQFVTATVQLPPPENVVEIPTSALADDGKQAAVFVQAGDKPGVYTLRRVEVVQRFDKAVFVRSKFADGTDEQPLTPEEKEDGLLPRRALKPGEKVITSGVLELKKELEDRESEGAKQ